MRWPNLKKYTMIILLGIMVLILLVGCSQAQPGEEDYTYDYENYEEYIYTFNEESFKFFYPKEGWLVEEQPAWEASEDIEASPDWGVHIYKEGDKENYISLFGSFTIWGVPEDDYDIEKEFIVDGTKKGTIHMNREDGFMDMYLIYEEGNYQGYHNAILKMDEDFYEDNKDVIWHILANI